MSGNAFSDSYRDLWRYFRHLCAKFMRYIFCIRSEASHRIWPSSYWVPKRPHSHIRSIRSIHALIIRCHIARCGTARHSPDIRYLPIYVGRKPPSPLGHGALWRSGTNSGALARSIMRTPQNIFTYVNRCESFGLIWARKRRRSSAHFDRDAIVALVCARRSSPDTQ